MSNETKPAFELSGEILTFDQILVKKQSFELLLKSIDGMEEKKKTLWLDIYENAFQDRMNAYMLFTELYASLSGAKEDHMTLGPALTKYIERMNKANDQLIKLAELISKEEERAESLDPGGLFKKISGG